MLYYKPSKVIESVPVTLEEAKEQLNILPSETTDDTYITKLINRALGIAEAYIEKDIREKTCTVIVEGKKEVHLQDGYIKSISQPASGFEAEYWPDYTLMTYDDAPSGNQTIIYKTGWVEADLPDEIRAAVLLKIAELYDVDRNNYTMSNLKSTEQFETVLRYHKKLRL